MDSDVYTDIPIENPAVECVRFICPHCSSRPGDGTSWESAFWIIQEGIDSAAIELRDNDTIEHCEIWIAIAEYYIYTESPTDTLSVSDNIHIYGGFQGTETSIEGRDATLRNRTIISGKNEHDGSLSVYHTVASGESVVIDGLVITGGTANGVDDNARGGGIIVVDGSLLLRNSIVVDNYASRGGGGIFSRRSSMDLVNTVISTNTTSLGCGGGIYCQECIFHATSTLMFRNEAEGEYGGAICIQDSNTNIRNSTIVYNGAFGAAGAILKSNGELDIINTILWYNLPDTIHNEGAIGYSIRYSNIEGGYGGTGNIESEPQFVSPTEDNFRLLFESQCIDAADGNSAPLNDIDNDPRVDIESIANTGVGVIDYVDIGAYEYQL